MNLLLKARWTYRSVCLHLTEPTTNFTSEHLFFQLIIDTLVILSLIMSDARQHSTYNYLSCLPNLIVFSFEVIIISLKKTQQT